MRWLSMSFDCSKQRSHHGEDRSYQSSDPHRRPSGLHTEAEEVPAAAGPASFRITAARCEGEMFRGFETILQGRDPLDAQQIVQRICGVCSIEHGIASCRAQEMAYGLKIKGNGRLLQNLMLAAEYSHSHLLHFYPC